jgi:hypothetical protein
MEEIVDYAMPMIKIESLMRKVHEYSLHSKYGDAADLCAFIVAESRLLHANLRLMQEKRDEQ